MMRISSHLLPIDDVGHVFLAYGVKCKTTFVAKEKISGGKYPEKIYVENALIPV